MADHDNPLAKLAANASKKPKPKPKPKVSALVLAKAKPEYDRINMERQMGGLSPLPPIEQWVQNR